MKMIIGGTAQGKLAYGIRKYPKVEWIDGRECGFDEIYECGGIYNFHIYIKRMMEADIQTGHLAAGMIDKNPGLYIISDEIGYGLVPIERFERDYREQTGRICTELAAFSESVERVVCGIGMTIKEA